MTKGKLAKFAELTTFSNALQKEDTHSDDWLKSCFPKGNEITLELACGKGSYTIQMAQLYPDRNFIGIDRKGDRLWRGAKTAQELNLTNAIFIRNRVENLTELFRHNEVSEIWITFPDPYIKRRTAKRRLTSPMFLNLYRKVLKKGGLVHLKTDEINLFRFTEKTLAEENCIIQERIDDLYANPIENEQLAIQTDYEKSHLSEGRTIRYLCFSFS